MVFQLKNFNGQNAIYIYVKTKDLCDKYLMQELNIIYCNIDNCYLLPENKTFSTSSDEQNKLNTISEFSVFQINNNGITTVLYDFESHENTLFVTGKCNSNCVMCPEAESSRRDGIINKTEILIEMLHYLPQNTEYLTITGGEPCMLGYGLIDILYYLKRVRSKIKVQLLSNGRAFSDFNYCKNVVNCAPNEFIMGIPLYAPDAILHDAITQTKGSFDQTIQGIFTLLHQKVNIELRIVVSKLNYKHIDELSDFIIRNFKNIRVVHFMGLEMLGNAAKYEDKVWISYSEALCSVQKSIDKLVENGFDVGLYNFPLCSVESKYWAIYEKSISEYKIQYLPECNLCIEKNACGGIFQGTIRMLKGQINPII